MANVIDMFAGDTRPVVPDFAELKAHGIWAAMHLCTRGTKFVDPRYAQRRAANADNLLWGAYHFLTASPVDEQAQLFLANCGDLTNLCIGVDYDDFGAASLQQLVSFMAALDHAGGQSFVFGGNRIRATIKPSLGGHQADDMKDAASFMAGHRLWLNEIGPHDNIPWPWNDPAMSPLAGHVWLWAFRQTGPVDPVIGTVNLHWSDAPDQQTLAQHWATP